MRWKPILVLENLPVGIVSILILMDNALEVLKEQVGFEKDLCFNPYSNGQCAGRIITVFTDDDQNCVSILVMLDNALEEVEPKIGTWPSKRFNPCYTGQCAGSA